MDKFFTVTVAAASPNPQKIIYNAMHQDYSEDFVGSKEINLSEEKCGEIIVNNLLKGGRGHYGPLEHPQITFNIGFFPHSTMQQIRTHRVGVSFDVQSGRYTGKRVVELGKELEIYLKSFPDFYTLALPEGYLDEVDKVFYLRPVGNYTDREGKKYEYNRYHRAEDIQIISEAVLHYRHRVDDLGFPEEHSRGLLPFDIRQHWVMSANVRSLMHLLDLRWKADAQLECQWLCDSIWPHFKQWVPSVADWYLNNRAKKAKLAP